MAKKTDKLDDLTVENARRSAYRKVFNSKDGHLVLRDMCRRRHVFDVPTANGMDPIKLAFEAGERSVVLGLVQMMDIEDKLDLMRDVNVNVD